TVLVDRPQPGLVLGARLLAATALPGLERVDAGRVEVRLQVLVDVLRARARDEVVVRRHRLRPEVVLLLLRVVPRAARRVTEQGLADAERGQDLVLRVLRRVLVLHVAGARRRVDVVQAAGAGRDHGELPGLLR